MSHSTIAALESARDIPGLIDALRNVQIRYPEESGDAARAQMAALGLDVLQGASINVIDLTGRTPAIDETADMRIEAARALGRLNDPAGNKALAESLRDENWQVRAAVIQALIQAYGKPMATALDGFEEKPGFVKADAIAQAQRLAGG